MKSRKLIPVESCPISSPKINEAIAKLVRMARDDKSAQVRLMARLGVPEGEAKVEWLADPDPFLAAAAVEVLSRQRGAPSGLTEAE